MRIIRFLQVKETCFNPTRSWWWWGGVGWITPYITLYLMEFYICPECRRSHFKKRLDTLQEEKGILNIKICNNDFLINSTEQHTQGHTSHFSFHGTFKLVAQDLSLESQVPHALTSQMFCEREKDVYIFILLSLFVFAYFRNKVFEHFVLF